MGAARYSSQLRASRSYCCRRASLSLYQQELGGGAEGAIVCANKRASQPASLSGCKRARRLFGHLYMWRIERNFTLQQYQLIRLAERPHSSACTNTLGSVGHKRPSWIQPSRPLLACQLSSANEPNESIRAAKRAGAYFPYTVVRLWLARPNSRCRWRAQRSAGPLAS